MQRLLTEAYDEFELEERETAEVPVSVYVGRYPEDVKEETVMEETIEANTTEEETGGDHRGEHHRGGDCQGGPLL